MLTLWFVCGCSEDVLDVKNENAYDGNTFFKDATSYKEASTAMYTPLLHGGMFSRDWYFVFDLLGNDAEKNFPLQGDLLDFPNYEHTPTNPRVSLIWSACYKMTTRALFVLDLMNKWETEKADEIALRDRITGEALFMKSLAYFWLVTLYGDVPMRNNLENFTFQLERTPDEQVWAQIESDLTQAIDLLPVKYADNADLGRATRGAAVALLGKSHLYQQEYDAAIIEFTKLTKAPFEYSLAGESLDDMFIYDKASSKDVVFAVMHGEWQGWGVGNAYYMFEGSETWGQVGTHTGRAMEYGFNGGDWYNVLVSDALVKSFSYSDESGDPYIDPRAATVFYGDAASGGDTEFCDDCETGPVAYDYTAKKYSWRKYEYYEFEAIHGVPHSKINSQVIRYADVLLMLAECYIEKAQLNDALPLINQVRARSGAFQYTTLGSAQTATTILRRERQMEFAGEQIRFFDLVRWGILVETLNAEKQLAIGAQPVKDFHVKLPIPQNERDANPKINAQVSGNWN